MKTDDKKVKKKRSVKAIKKCGYCGENYEVSGPLRIKTRRYCSNSCSAHCKCKTHGRSGPGIYSSWKSMIRRCKSDPKYTRRGIRVEDERWFDMDNFISDMGEKPSKKHSIDRIDNDKGYYKENCRWATPNEQARNKSNNKIIEYNGVKKCLSEWAEEFDVNYKTLFNRLEKLGWSFEKALKTPVRAKKANKTPAKGAI